MTEQEWLVCADVWTMLELVGRSHPRKVWLFTIACARRLLAMADSPGDRACVEVAERFAEGLATGEEMLTLEEDLWDIRWYQVDPWNAASRMASTWLDDAANRVTGPSPEAQRQAHDRAGAELCLLLRELLGNPFRPVGFNSDWRGQVLSELATAAYEDRGPTTGALSSARLAVLSDALEEAGCTEVAILDHLRAQRLTCAAAGRWI